MERMPFRKACSSKHADFTITIDTWSFKEEGQCFQRYVFFEVCCLASGILRLIPRTAPYWLSEAYGPTAERGMYTVK